jgi:Zn finger protein HypA/HybF involved in hydrogenase expression
VLGVRVSLTAPNIVRTMPRQARYTDSQIIEAVKSSISVMEVMRKLGIVFAGGSHSHISKRISKMQLDTTHFKGQRVNSGRVFGPKKSSEQIFVFDELAERRTPGHILTRNMLATGTEYKCECGCDGTWRGSKITLHVDHIDGNWKNNTKDNLRFMCPNCHSQTETFGSKNMLV